MRLRVRQKKLYHKKVAVELDTQVEKLLYLSEEELLTVQKVRYIKLKKLTKKLENLL